MKTIIIGGSGLFGLNWAIKQYQTDEIILLLHNKYVEFNGVKSIKIDYNNFKTLEDNIKSLEPDLIINAAAITNVDFCESNVNLTYEANVQLAFDLAKIACKLNTKFIHISTDHLFDGINENLLNNYSVLIKDDIIYDIAPDSIICTPENVKIITLEGRLISPGLIESHGHQTFNEPWDTTKIKLEKLLKRATKISNKIN